MSLGHTRLSELFGAALELSRDAREQLVAAVRADDAALAAELVALLEADARAATALRTGGLRPALIDTDPTVPGLPHHAHSTARGSGERISVPGYRVDGLLGEGGMGAVYAGAQESPPRPVAIKVLHVRSGPALARFWTEAAIMARLDHPGIARVLESGESEGHPFIVMERVEGRTLDTYVRETTAPVRRRLELVAAVCDAVHHAHVNGVIHRDLKPTNVMVRDDGRIAVLDFGIARTAGSSSNDTRAGELIGTPLYMSPEQARLRPDEVDARSDVYSLGVTLYELVAGQLPYELRDLPLPAVSLVVCETPARPLRHDRDLDAITAQALAKEPEHRYQSAAALADDLRRYLDGRAVSVRTPGTLEQLRRFARRRPAIATAMVGALLATAVFVIVVTQLWLDAREARTAAEQARARSEAARTALAARTADLVLQQARAVVGRDPTAALALLGELHGTAVDPWAVAVVAAEARGRGVAESTTRVHRGEIHDVEELADGSLVTASYDGTARRVWAGGSELLYTAPGGRVHVARPSPDGARFAIAGDGGALVVARRAAHGGGVVALPGHASDVERVAWSRDGAWLASGDESGVVLLWPGGAGPSRSLGVLSGKVEALAFTDDSRALIVGDEAGDVYRWELATGARQRVALGRTGIRAVWGDGDQLAAATETGVLYRWRIAATGLVPTATIATRVVTKRAAFAAGGTSVVFAGVEGTVVVVDGERVAQLGAHTAKVRGLSITSDGQRIATGSEDGEVRVWDRAVHRQWILRGHSQRIRQLALARGGAALLSADGDGNLRRWNVATMPATLFHAHPAPLEHLALAPDARRVISVDARGQLVAADLATGGAVDLGAPAPRGRITALSVLGELAVTADSDGEVAMWGRDGVARRTNVGDPVRALAASPAGDRLAVALASGPIALLDASGALRATLTGHPDGTEALAFSPSGGLLASGGQDRVLRVWQLDGDGARELATLAGPTDDTRRVAFSPSGAWLVAAGDDGQLRAWSVSAAPGQPPVFAPVTAPAGAALVHHGGTVTALAFDASGRWLATAGRDASLARTDLAASPPRSERATTPSIATAVAIDARGVVVYATEAGDAGRWTTDGALSTIPVSLAVTAAAALPGGALALGSSDGTLRVLSP